MRICVFCGSSFGTDPAFTVAAETLGASLAKRDYTLVYGGASVGLMGALANAALREGGKVLGVLPDFLEKKELGHDGLTELFVVSSMHERKAQMASLADAFIALPGGYGTLEELSEMLTWAQLGLHRKACALLNISGYYDHLVAFLDHAVGAGLLRPGFREMLIVEKDVDALLDHISHYQPPNVPRILDATQT